MKSLTDQFISDYYQALLHLEGTSLSTTLTYIYDGIGNKSGIGLSGENVIIDNLFLNTKNELLNIIDYVYPVHSVILTIENINPQDRFPNTTWEQISQGRFLAGVGAGNDGTDSRTINPGTGGGTYNHKLKIEEIPNHSHGLDIWKKRGVDIDSDYMGWQTKKIADFNENKTASVGGDQAHNNTPPEFGIYVWKRTQ